MEKTKKGLVWEYAKAIITALLLALLIRAVFIQAFKIPSGSMLSTLLVGDHILVNKISMGTPVDVPFTNTTLFRTPGFGKPERGDIIVFKYPEDPTRDFIKRVIAVEGDVIESRNKVIYVNGKPLTEPYTQRTDTSVNSRCPEGTSAFGNDQCHRDNFGPLTVPGAKYFMMGDNRDQSFDSRFWGYVDQKDIRGKALIIYWSWDNKKHWPRLERIGGLVK